MFENEFFESALSVCPPDEFEGLYQERYPDGQLKYRGFFEKNCVRTGQHLEFWPNGFVKEISYFANNRIVGTSLNFYENGTRESEQDYLENGSKKGNWIEKNYGSETGMLLSIYRNIGNDSESLWLHANVEKIESEFREEWDQMIQDSVQDFFREISE